MSAECSPAEAYPVVDSPRGSPVPLPAEDQIPPDWMHCVLWKAIDNGMWRVWVRNNGEQAVSPVLERVEAYLVEAKKTLASTGEGGNLAAVGLRIASSQFSEL